VTGVAAPLANSAGWFRSPVSIDWNSIDPEPSTGAPTKPAPTTVTTEGKDQVVTSGNSCDPVGNCATGTVMVSIDSTPPTISVAGNTGTYASTDVVAITCTATDALSGIASQTCPTLSGVASSFGVGAKRIQ
jgi:hypothetical protein